MILENIMRALTTGLFLAIVAFIAPACSTSGPTYTFTVSGDYSGTCSNAASGTFDLDADPFTINMDCGDDWSFWAVLDGYSGQADGVLALGNTDAVEGSVMVTDSTDGTDPTAVYVVDDQGDQATDGEVSPDATCTVRVSGTGDSNASGTVSCGSVARYELGDSTASGTLDPSRTVTIDISW